jgi:CheY-like chemotaxis protein
MRKKILVVDDDVDILDAIAIVLDEFGYAVTTTSKGHETYKKIEEIHPDVILLDVLMSGSDGREICRELKSKEETRKIPVIMVSAHPDAAKEVKAVGADNFLAKPFETGDLLKLVERYSNQNTY